MVVGVTAEVEGASGANKNGVLWYNCSKGFLVAKEGVFFIGGLVTVIAYLVRLPQQIYKNEICMYVCKSNFIKNNFLILKFFLPKNLPHQIHISNC